jgi:membrane-bound metal-dependent hydrolase YbcI (DUF457 family)
MAQAVVHVLFTIIIIDLFRDHIIKDKRKIPLHFVFIGGVAGLLPDIDVPLFWLLSNILGFSIPWFHRVFTHTFLFAGLFFILSLFFYKYKKKLSLLFGIITFGVLFHIFLDWFFTESISPLYPFVMTSYGLNFAGIIGFPIFMEGLEAIVLLAWLWHEEKAHKISDFI